MKLILGGYSQLPFGSSDSSLERMLSYVLNPLLKYLYLNPSVFFNLYLSARELEWLESAHPEVLLMLSELIKRNQLNILTGSYYQAVLHAVPLRERSEHIEMMTTLIRRRFGKKADTLWVFNQIWAASTVGVMSLVGIKNLFISTYDPITGHQSTTSPFIMNELGRTINVYPVDDRCQALVKDYAEGIISTRDLLESASKMTPLRSCSANTVMINLDQLAHGAPDCWQIFETIASSYKSRGVATALPDPQTDVSGTGYLSTSSYGRDDMKSGNKGFRETVCDDMFLSAVYDLRFTLDDIYLQNKKPDRAKRKTLEKTMMQSSSGAVYSSFYSRPYVVQDVMRSLYNAFDIVCEGDIPPVVLYDGQRVCMSGKNFMGVFSSRGGSLLALTYRPARWCYSGSSCLFTDSFRPENAQKTRNLSAEKYSMDSVDRKKSDISFSLKGEINKRKFVINKTFHIKSSMILAEISITNSGTEELSGVYSVSFPIACNGYKRTPVINITDKSHQVSLSEGKALLDSEKSVRIQDFENGVNLSIVASRPFGFSKEEEYEVHKDGAVYRDTLIIPSWNVKLQKNETLSLSLALRFEQTKQR